MVGVMASTTYAVIRTRDAWTIFQDGEALEGRATKSSAVEIAHLLATQSEALGARSELLVQDDGGELHAWDMNKGGKLLARLYALRKASGAADRASPEPV